MKMYENIFLNCFTCTIVILTNTKSSYCELYSAIDYVAKVVETQQIVQESMERTLKELESLTSKLKQFQMTFSKHHAEAIKDEAAYIGNPVNAYTLIKRLSIDYEQMNNVLRDSFERTKTLLRKKSGLSYPAQVDLSGSVKGIVRLIEIYNLDHRNLSDGNILYKHSTPMTSNDVYIFAKQLIELADYDYAYIWLAEAARKFDVHSKFTLADIYLSMGDCQMKLGNYTHALQWYDYTLDLMPFKEEAQMKKEQLLKIVKENGDVWEKPTEVKEGRLDSFHHKLCRGDLIPHKDVYNKLKCFYKDGTHPFLKIAPYKVEEIHPRISLVVYHDVIQDDEIERLKEITFLRFNKSLQFDDVDRALYVKGNDVSQSVFYTAENHPEIAKLYKRITMMTGLHIKPHELMAVFNYGIGGLFSYHHDFLASFDPKAKEVLPAEKQIGTAILYLTDVEMGGDAVFPYLGTSIRPKKGTAAFWRNLHPSGEGNRLSTHGSCPVLFGSKWGANIFIQQGGQDKLFPCTLENEEENTVKLSDIKKPMLRHEYLSV